MAGGTASGGASPNGGESASGGVSTTGGMPGGGAGGASGGSDGGTAGAGGDVGASGEGGDAGSGGASGGASGGGSGDACASALFCDDFESYTADQAPGGSWKTRTNSGTVVVDGTQARSGSKSVKLTAQAGGNIKTAFMRIEGSPVFPVDGNAFYGRMMFYLESAPTADVHWTFIEAGGLVPGQDYRALYRYGGQHPVEGGSQLMANYETPDSYADIGPKTDCWLHSQGEVVPVGRWACVEWQYDGPNNTMRIWMDGVALEDLTMTGTGQGCVSGAMNFTWTAPTFGHLELGWESFQQDDARTIWIDDVVISTMPIGCPE